MRELEGEGEVGQSFHNRRGCHRKRLSGCRRRRRCRLMLPARRKERAVVAARDLRPLPLIALAAAQPPQGRRRPAWRPWFLPAVLGGRKVPAAARRPPRCRQQKLTRRRRRFRCRHPLVRRRPATLQRQSTRPLCKGRWRARPAIKGAQYLPPGARMARYGARRTRAWRLLRRASSRTTRVDGGEKIRKGRIRRRPVARPPRTPRVRSPPVRRAVAAVAMPLPLPTRAQGTAQSGRREEAPDASYGCFDVAHYHQHQPSNRRARRTALMKVSNRATQTALCDTRTTNYSPTATGFPWSAYPMKNPLLFLQPLPQASSMLQRELHQPDPQHHVGSPRSRRHPRSAGRRELVPSVHYTAPEAQMSLR